MTHLSKSMGVKRGFHRVGLALSIVLGVFALAGGAIFSWDSAGSQREHFLALKCAAEKLDAESAKTSASPPQISDVHDFDGIALGAVFIDPNGTKRRRLPAEIPIGKMGCGYSSETASREELTALPNGGFSYSATLASYLGITALITGLFGSVVYFSVAAFSWIVRGFMRGSDTPRGEEGGQLSKLIKPLLKWAVFLAVIGVLIAPAEYVTTSTKFVTAICALILSGVWLKGALVRWIKSDGKAPYWDEIESVPPIIPEPPLKASGPIGRVIGDFSINWSLKWLGKNKDAPAYLNAMGEMFDIGTKHTPKNPVEAMRWYKAAVGGGDPAKVSGPAYSKLRIAEMYEDGEGVPRDLEQAGRIYNTMLNFPSAMLHFAIAHVEGRGVPQDHVEAYRLLLLADKALSWHPPTKKGIEVNPQSHRANRRHIRARELMAILEARMTPEQLLRAREAAREWWNAHR